jgi:hypothetical protein
MLDWHFYLACSSVCLHICLWCSPVSTKYKRHVLYVCSIWCKYSSHKFWDCKFWAICILSYVFFSSLVPQWFKEETLWLDREIVGWASGESISPHEVSRHTYPCKMCGKVFKTCSSLSKHKDVHRGTTRCLVCNTVLSRASYLKQHMTSVHGLPPQ